ncbi:phospholipase B1, membrane-associated-like [Saccoglossus kowalevskii]
MTIVDWKHSAGCIWIGTQTNKPSGLKDFPCNVGIVKGEKVADSVHSLRPGDVKVVGAIGDSLTAGNGARASVLPQCLIEYRGSSFSVGGANVLEKQITFPNILKKYNPNVVGFSKGTSMKWFNDEDKSQFNVAVAGADAKDILGQARVLIKRMKSHHAVDFVNDWKIVTVLIGGNDLCDWCDDKEIFKPERYISHIRETLDLLHSEMPRTFVNLLLAPNVIELAKLSGISCKVVHHFLCECASFGNEVKLMPILQQYRVLTKELVASGRYDTKDDFTVVLQPFLEKTTIPTKKSGDVDYSYIAPDCFHFSVKGHEQASKALWHNMLEPVGNKSTLWMPGEPLRCPTQENPFFYTALNSESKPKSFATSYGGSAGEDNPSGRTVNSALIGFIGVLAILACVIITTMLVIKSSKNKLKGKTEENEWLLTMNSVDA